MYSSRMALHRTVSWWVAAFAISYRYPIFPTIEKFVKTRYR